MKSNLRFSVATRGFLPLFFAVCLVSVPLRGNAQLMITFDDVAPNGNGGPLPIGYQGLTWANVGVLDATAARYTGYYAGMVSPNNVAYNGNGNAASISSAAPFRVISGSFTAAWRDNLQLEIKGYKSGSLAYDHTYTLSATHPTLVTLNYLGVDRIDLISTGGTAHSGYSESGTQFVLDDLSVDLPNLPVNSGSDGSDGNLNYTANGTLTIDMADHPDGIYQYSWVNLGSFSSVRFISNTENAPVVWLVQGTCIIDGKIDVSGQNASGQAGGRGGPGGYFGGNGGAFGGSAGQGPGGGLLGGSGFSASFGDVPPPCGSAAAGFGAVYGNEYLLPLVGGSGGGGMTNQDFGGGGGGGAILIAASGPIILNGKVVAVGGGPTDVLFPGTAGAGSGGAVRLVTPAIYGSGIVDTSGGHNLDNSCIYGGEGRIRIDVLDNHFTGTVHGSFSQGFQPIIIPPPNQAISLAIQSVGGSQVASSPAGVLSAPDVIIGGQQANPLPIVVRCGNIPLHTEITVDVKPANGHVIEATAANDTGTEASSTATIFVNMPRGGGTIQARAVSGITGTLATSLAQRKSSPSYGQTGLTAKGERFRSVRVESGLGGSQHIDYITASGKSYPSVVP